MEKVNQHGRINGIDVDFRANDWDGTKINRATVNWAAYGSVSIEEAETFVAHLQEAIALAKSFLV